MYVFWPNLIPRLVAIIFKKLLNILDLIFLLITEAEAPFSELQPFTYLVQICLLGCTAV
jgi:hypothetical protein